MAHNYAHGPSMSNHFVLPTNILRKVRPFKHAKSHDLQSHPMWWVMSVAGKHNPLAQTYKPKVDNLCFELWHTKEYFVLSNCKILHSHRHHPPKQSNSLFTCMNLHYKIIKINYIYNITSNGGW
jgi:VanZ family protein